jgi:small subunit ribosomal protein S7
MSRRKKSNSKRKFLDVDPIYNNYLVSLLIIRILKNGKKTLAQKIIQDAFNNIKKKTNEDPLITFEKAVKNASPVVEVKATRRRGSTYQVPVEITGFRATNLALSWLVKFSKGRSGRGISMKLANELIDTSKGIGNTIRKREETHRMAEANKAFSHYRY